MKPLVSILIPAYNAEGWIAESLQSAIEQTWPRKEIIVVDDGSRDSTLAIAQSYAGPNVQVVSQENGGASAARNRLLSLAQGDYMQWLDADDLLAPDKVAKQMEYAGLIGSSRMLLSGSWGKFYHNLKRAQFNPTALWGDLQPAEWLFRKLDQNLWMAIESWLVSRTLSELAGPWNENLSVDDDGEYFCRLVSKSEGVKFVPQAKCFCRRSEFNSLSRSLDFSLGGQDSQFESMRLQIAHLRSTEETVRVREACLKYLRRWLVHFYPERPDILARANELAADLGGSLEIPRLPWKYAWMTPVIGWRLAKRVSIALRRTRGIIHNAWDRLAF